MSSARGFSITYTSARRLDADHAAYLTHGGMLLKVDGRLAPPVGTDLDVRIEAPGAQTFVIRAQAGRLLPGRGLMVSFTPGGVATAALDAYVQSPSFAALCDAEPAGDGEAPTVIAAQLPSTDEADDLATDPNLDTSALDLDTDLGLNLNAATSEEVPAALAIGAQPAELHLEEDTAATAAGPTTMTAKIGPPGPGEEYFVLVLTFPTVTAFVELSTDFETTATLGVPYADDGLCRKTAPVQLRLTLPGRNVFEIWGVADAVGVEVIQVRVNPEDEAFRKVMLYPSSVSARKRLEREALCAAEDITVLRIKQEMPNEDLERMPIRRRLARMGMDDKINMALSGDREHRMALAMDGNKAVHHYLLKNAKITLDEVAFMARLPSLNPDVLDKIAENPAYTQNPTVTKALVYNPRTPIRTAIRLLDRLPRSEVMSLAKRISMNQRLVMAAKKKLERRGR